MKKVVVWKSKLMANGDLCVQRERYARHCCLTEDFRHEWHHAGYFFHFCTGHEYTNQLPSSGKIIPRALSKNVNLRLVILPNKFCMSVWLIFWHHIVNPDKSSAYLIGCTVGFWKEIKLSFSSHCSKINSGLKLAIFIYQNHIYIHIKTISNKRYFNQD